MLAGKTITHGCAQSVFHLQVGHLQWRVRPHAAGDRHIGIVHDTARCAAASAHHASSVVVAPSVIMKPHEGNVDRDISSSAKSAASGTWMPSRYRASRNLQEDGAAPGS